MSADEAARPVRYRDAKPRQRFWFRVVVIVMSIVVLGVLLVVADMLIRGYAEDRVSSEVEKSLPTSVEGDVTTMIDGPSIITQLIGGRLDQVHLTSDDLTVQGFPVVAAIDLTGVPTDTSKPIESATGTFTLGQETVAGLMAASGIEGDIALGAGGLSYTTGTAFLGQNIDVTIQTRPVLDSGRMVFRADSAQLSLAGFDFDATALLDRVVPNGLSVCVAQYLPADVSLDAVDIVGDEAVIDLSATDLVLDESALARTGVCN
ncbi:DUF2993 domain-containing protein [Amnibacterium flavum]|uniref:DUF2993 domain-containing protein n=1 Tax=Amnibacterium flavum TaxID=2173173 RepID=A0A2V1HZ27_9MICO|nr:DUF2993 domain-containing protein [Amnibacterium flavum]PVZ96197.1 hypothetical protein DDQ50_07180 [Amnibacterium flavum]